jgi:hypothetical protein
MFKRNEYAVLLEDIGLSNKQTSKLRNVLAMMMNHANRTADKVAYPEGKGRELTRQEALFVAHYEGKASGIDAIDRFLRGDMNAHDELEE